MRAAVARGSRSALRTCAMSPSRTNEPPSRSRSTMTFRIASSDSNSPETSICSSLSPPETSPAPTFASRRRRDSAREAASSPRAAARPGSRSTRTSSSGAPWISTSLVPATERSRSATPSLNRPRMARSTGMSASQVRPTMRVNAASSNSTRSGAPEVSGSSPLVLSRSSRMRAQTSSTRYSSSFSSIAMVERPAREVDLISLISSNSARVSSMISVTRASTRSASAPGNTVKTVAFLCERVGSSARGSDTRADEPAVRMSRSVSVRSRGLR